MTDRVLRAMTDDGAFRTMVARTTDTVREIVKRSGAKGDAIRALGELVTGAILIRETMSPSQRVQAIVKGAGNSGTLVADSNPEGWSRGLVQKNDKSPNFRLGDGALLQVQRTLLRGEVHHGVVEAPASGLSEAFMAYMQQSEQIETVMRCAVVIENDEIKAAGGYLVQLLPEAPDREQAVLILAQRLEDDFLDIASRLDATNASPDELLSEILWGMDYTMLGDSPLRFGCDCSHIRVLSSLATLGRGEIDDLISTGEALDIDCDWCGNQYRVEVEDLRNLLDPS